MPVRHYGIYLAYPPTVDLRAEGLGRHLAMFLKGADELADVQFTLVCPSWSRATLEALFASEQVATEIFRIVSPARKPYALIVFEAIKVYRARPVRQRRFTRISKWLADSNERLWQRLTKRAVTVHGAATLLLFFLEAIVLLVMLTPLLCLAMPFVALILLTRMLRLLSHRLPVVFRGKWRSLLARSLEVLAAPEQKNWVLRLFEEMQIQEMRRMHAMISTLTAVRAWYCPTAFWPSFHDIKAPRLLCVPDVVLSDFPVGYAGVGGNRFLNTFEALGRAIRAGEHFVTYSETVKWNTLVDRYAVTAANVTVIPHAPNALNGHVELIGFADGEASSRLYCQSLLRRALQRSSNPAYTAHFDNSEVKFLFYASQFRPNKNVLMLLRAFVYLLRKVYLGHKLILTGYPTDMPEIRQFVIDHRLQNEVIFLHGLSVSELAACYKLADLAVNPSLSEGGCPFTFAEALSVGTPVVMSRIAVSEEVLTEPHCQALTLFDPFDWRDCAKRIEWAVKNRQHLLAIQRTMYAQLKQRTWRHVVQEYVGVLDKISANALTSSCR